MADAQTFTGIDAAKWERIQDLVKQKAGITIATDGGTASAKGITLLWSYIPALETLAITLVKRSFYDPSEQTIDTDIAQWIAQA